MSNPIASFSGLASGIQWRDIVDQLVQVERSRTVAPLEQQMAMRQEQRTAWSTFKSLTEKLNDASRALRAGSIGGFTAFAPASATTSRTLLNATASSSAAAGAYKVEVLQLAQASKLSGNAVADTKTALGWTGDFAVNGASIAIDAADTLEVVRNKINGANTGLTPTGVSATILSDGGSGGRIVLTRTTPGATPIEITDGTGGMARELGFLDSRSKPVSSTVVAIATALGVQTSPAPASIRIDGKLVTLDLASDSIADIVAKINAAGAQASALAEPFGDETRYRLQVQGNVQAVDGDADSAAIIETLGVVAGGYGDVKQTVSSGVFTSSADAVATAATSLEGLKIGGASANLAAGDAINIRGMRGDGTAVTIGLVIEPGDTMQTLLDRINDATSGFGSGARPASATLGSDGAIRLMDGTGGESRLALSLGITRADGTTDTLGVPTTTTAGRARELVVGQDAQVMVDGVMITRSSNTIAEVIPGVSLSLLNAEPGTEIDLTVSKNVDNGLASVKSFAEAYNEILKFFDEQRAAGQPLSGSSTLRGIVSDFTSSLRTEVATNGTYSRLSLMGLALDRSGVLTVDESAVRKALSEKPDEVEALFGFDGVGNAFVDATDNATRFGTGTISSQIKSIDDGDFRLNQRKTEAERRLADRQAALISQYVKMESALSALNSQGSFLSQQLASFQANR